MCGGNGDESRTGRKKRSTEKKKASPNCNLVVDDHGGAGAEDKLGRSKMDGIEATFPRVNGEGAFGRGREATNAMLTQVLQDIN